MTHHIRNLAVLTSIIPWMLHAAITTISQDTLASWVTNGTSFDFILIDVRTPQEVASGIIATDSCRPYNFSWNGGTFASIIPQIPLSASVVLYCGSGYRTGLAADSLDKAGIQHVYQMANGFSSWTGPRKDSTFLKPPSLFPQPSRLANATGIVLSSSQKQNDFQPSPAYFAVPGISRISAVGDRETIFDLRGRITGAAHFAQRISVPLLVIPGR